MFDKPAFEIPDAVRQMAEQNIEQTRQAYQQFQMFAQQAQMMMMKSQGDGLRALFDAQTKAMRLAQDNIEANFRFASDLARARDINEYAEIQRRYAEGQVKLLQSQGEEMARLLSDLSRKMTTPG